MRECCKTSQKRYQRHPWNFAVFTNHHFDMFNFISCPFSNKFISSFNLEMFSLTKRFKSKQWLLALSNDFLKNKKLLYKKYFEA